MEIKKIVNINIARNIYKIFTASFLKIDVIVSSDFKHLLNKNSYIIIIIFYVSKIL